MLCDQVRDPGNLGTVIRCADAFGADAVLVSRDSVDLGNAKTVRASTGSVFHLPVAVEVDVAAATARARALGLAVYGADGAGPSTVDDLAAAGRLGRPALWVLGNEAWGLPPEHAELVDALVAAADVRPGREPQPLHRGRRLPLRHRHRPARRLRSLSRRGPFPSRVGGPTPSSSNPFRARRPDVRS